MIKQLYEKVRDYTMCGPIRTEALGNSIHRIVSNGVDGDFLEAGVYRGGQSMAMAYMLREMNENRHIWMYDTYEGMPYPGDHDTKTHVPTCQRERWRLNFKDGKSTWLNCSLDKVKENMGKTLYPKKYLHYIKGDVCDTLDKFVPEKIALLRLDTDLYESTKKLLEVLYPRLSDGGVLIIDDYGAWDGCRKAVSEYFNMDNDEKLTYIDSSCRELIKNESI